MDKNQYIIKSRYEYRGSNGITWTDWFVINSVHMDKKTAESYIEQYKKLSDDVDKKTKLKHEYVIELIKNEQ